MGNTRNNDIPRRVSVQYVKYIVAPCAAAAMRKQFFHLYFNSINAGHHRADIICMNIMDRNIGGDSGNVIIAANIMKLDKKNILYKCFGLGLPFKSVKAYHEEAFGFGYHMIPSHRCDHTIYLARTYPHTHAVKLKTRNIHCILICLNVRIYPEYYLFFPASMELSAICHYLILYLCAPMALMLSVICLLL